MDLSGKIHNGRRADAYLNNQLNIPNTYRGLFNNLEYVGMTTEELVTLWNLEHREDPIP